MLCIGCVDLFDLMKKVVLMGGFFFVLVIGLFDQLQCEWVVVCNVFIGFDCCYDYQDQLGNVDDDFDWKCEKYFNVKCYYGQYQQYGVDDGYGDVEV